MKALTNGLLPVAALILYTTATQAQTTEERMAEAAILYVAALEEIESYFLMTPDDQPAPLSLAARLGTTVRPRREAIRCPAGRARNNIGCTLADRSRTPIATGPITYNEADSSLARIIVTWYEEHTADRGMNTVVSSTSLVLEVSR